jgi:hypothetical protein
MLKQNIVIIICLFLLVSCSFFEDRTNQIQKVDTIVDFNSIDAFPLFPDCENIPSRDKQQICFQLEMAQHIYAALKQYSLKASEVVNDTIFVKMVVGAAGETSLSSIKISDKTNELLPELDSIIRLTLKNIPKLQPAIKRNMPVSTEFTLPIILTN